MFRRAVREPRVIAGLSLVVVSVAIGLYEIHADQAQADRDFARCATLPNDCRVVQKPTWVVASRSSSNAFRVSYSLNVRTSSHTTLTLDGISARTAGLFGDQSESDVRYRNGHAVAIVARDGTAVEVPFVFSTRLAVIAGVVFALGVLGLGSIAWGFTRVNRTRGKA